MAKEKWVLVEDSRKYLVSNRGRVKNTKGKFLRLSDNGKGYKNVSIHGKKRYVHRLVATAFLEKPVGKEDVNHKNGKKDDNSLSNLEWVTKSENYKYSFDNGFSKPPSYVGQEHPYSKLSRGDVIRIKMGLQLGMRQTELAKIFGVQQPLIWKIKEGRNWTHIKLKEV